eukprot:TRINITY_DN2307_c0_g5_i1.p1 TRINITY_DN2307_c0_g5~~TRINITY_DN2307_c0_g5_i1.p1  ORF type:complete len:623 (+),score=151.63 TRINITY_DN2307_c0_g5_i1:36-1871(+)
MCIRDRPVPAKLALTETETEEMCLWEREIIVRAGKGVLRRMIKLSMTKIYLFLFKKKENEEYRAGIETLTRVTKYVTPSGFIMMKICAQWKAVGGDRNEAEKETVLPSNTIFEEVILALEDTLAKRYILEKNPILGELYHSLVVNGQMSDEQYWRGNDFLKRMRRRSMEERAPTGVATRIDYKMQWKIVDPRLKRQELHFSFEDVVALIQGIPFLQKEFNQHFFTINNDPSIFTDAQGAKFIESVNLFLKKFWESQEQSSTTLVRGNAPLLTPFFVEMSTLDEEKIQKIIKRVQKQMDIECTSNEEVHAEAEMNIVRMDEAIVALPKRNDKDVYDQEWKSRDEKIRFIRMERSFRDINREKTIRKINMHSASIIEACIQPDEEGNRLGDFLCRETEDDRYLRRDLASNEGLLTRIGTKYVEEGYDELVRKVGDRFLELKKRKLSFVHKRPTKEEGVKRAEHWNRLRLNLGQMFKEEAKLIIRYITAQAPRREPVNPGQMQDRETHLYKHVFEILLKKVKSEMRNSLREVEEAEYRYLQAKANEMLKLFFQADLKDTTMIQNFKTKMAAFKSEVHSISQKGQGVQSLKSQYEGIKTCFESAIQLLERTLHSN